MISYYDKGEKYFSDGDIFINKCDTKETPIHAHSFVEIAFVSEGYGIHKIGDLEFPCSKGEIYIINHDISHQFIANINSKFKIYNCIFKPNSFNYSLIDSKKFYHVTHSFLIKLISGDINLNMPKIKLNEDDFIYINELYNDMLNEFTLKDEGYIEILNADLVKLIIFILRRTKNEMINKNKNDILEKVILYIHDNYYKGLTIEDLSMMAFLSPSHFSRLFKQYSGMTVKEFTQKIRIEEACKLLLNSRKNISEIAFEVGYSDIKYFNSLFKKLKGITPNEYRKMS